MSGTELAVRQDAAAWLPDSADLVSLEVVRAAIDQFVADGAIDEIVEGQARAAAMAAYENRRKAHERARYFSHVLILAEAALGMIDLQENPFGRKTTKPLIVTDEEVPWHARERWRMFGQAKTQGILDEALAASEEIVGISPSAVYLELRRRGCGYFDPEPFRSAITQTCRPEGRAKGDRPSYHELAERTGVDYHVVYRILNKRLVRVPYDQAIVLAAELGLSEDKLRPMARRHRRKQPKGRLPPTRRLKGGRWDQAYVLHRKLMQEVFELTGEGGDPDLWTHLHAAEDILKRKIR